MKPTLSEYCCPMHKPLTNLNNGPNCYALRDQEASVLGRRIFIYLFLIFFYNQVGLGHQDYLASLDLSQKP